MASTADLLNKAEAPLKYEHTTGRHLFMEPFSIHSSRKAHNLMREIIATTGTLSMLIVDGITPRPSEFDTVEDYNEAFSEYKAEAENISDLDINTFLTRLTRHIKTYYTHVNKKYKGKVHYLECLRICLPRGYSEKNYAALADDIMSTYFSTEEYGVVPYFYGAVVRNTVTYLLLFFANHYYYPDTIIKDILAPTDSYRNPVNGQACSKDTPNAQLRWTRGTVLHQDVVYFSDRFDFFKMHPKKYKDMLIGIKDIMQRHFYMANPAPDHDAHFGRINYDHVSPYMKKMSYAYNQMLMKMEDKASDVICAMREAGFDDPKDKERLTQFILVWREKVLKLNIPVKYGRKKLDIHICLRHPLPLKALHRKIEIIYGSFELALEDLKQKIWRPENIGLELW